MSLLQTPLNARHRALGAKMVDFGGWDMPVQYHSILKEHEAVRQRAGLFDVSHMGVIELSGPEAEAALQYLVPNDVSRLQAGQGLYTQLCQPDGGMLDDLLVFKLPESWWLVVNAGNKESDLSWVSQQLGHFEAQARALYQELGILALQGPCARQILGRLAPQLDLRPESFKAFDIQPANLAGIELMLSCSGYTGEDGFEIYAPAAELESLWDQLLAAGQPEGLEPVGLGARDTLRLEAAMPLYGHELDQQTSPLEAGLGWSVKLNKPMDFIGKAALLEQKAQGLQKKRIGFMLPNNKRAPRQGYEVCLGEQTIGVVTSGSISPSLGFSIGMAYIEAPWHQDLPQDFEINIRGQLHAATSMQLPFYRRPR